MQGVEKVLGWLFGLALLVLVFSHLSQLNTSLKASGDAVNSFVGTFKGV